MDFPTQDEIDRWRMCLADEELFGKNGDSIEFRLPTELKEALARRAGERGTSTAALLRLAAVTFLYGPDHVGMIVARHYGVAHQRVPESVRTNAGQAVS